MRSKRLDHLARGLALAGTGPHRAHRDDRDVGLEHGGVGAEQDEGRPCRHGDAGLVHHGGMRDVGVREHHVVDLELADQRRQVLFQMDRDPFRIAGAGQLGRIAAVLDEGDLGGGEGHHGGVGVVPVHHVEVMEVATRRTHDQDTLAHLRPSFDVRRRRPPGPGTRASLRTRAQSVKNRRLIAGAGRSARPAARAGRPVRQEP